MSTARAELTRVVDSYLQDHEAEFIDFRRDLHAHPELGHEEYRTSQRIAEHLRGLGLAPSYFPSGTGVVCDIGSGARAVALRADIDALPIFDTKDVPYRSRNVGVCHACGHDVHTAALIGAASALVAAGDLPGRVRLIFQPAEEQVPGGALEAVEIGAVDHVSSIFTLHCDPRLDTGYVGLRVGAITAACDTIDVVLSGPGGHTARPQLTTDLVYALGKVIVEVPAMVSRRVDPRAGMSLVWGAVSAGIAGNAIPQSGSVKGTIRMLDRDVWDGAEKLIRELVETAVAGTGAAVDIRYERGVPPVVNDAAAVEVQRRAVVSAIGPDGIRPTEQSMGGEDFGWLVGARSGALARLGVRAPDDHGPMQDLHQGGFAADERALVIGARFLAHTALHALTE
jgi:amidohydrolase